MNRCLNNFFAYCTGTPDITGPGTPVSQRNPFTKTETIHHYHRRCSRDHKTCPDMAEHRQLAPTNQPGTIQHKMRGLSLE